MERVLEFQDKRVLVIAPHTDDAEFGCGATIFKLSQVNQVFCTVFSACKQSVLPQFPEDVLITEFKAASTILGLKSDNLTMFDYPVRTFSHHRQSILDDLIRLREKIRPDVVFLPSTNDIHQDHKTIAEEGIRTFKQTTILSYEMVWNNLTFNTTCFSVLEQNHLDAKIKALKQYKSQEHRPYANPEFIESLARVRGVQVGTAYAECFDVVRFYF